MRFFASTAITTAAAGVADHAALDLKPGPRDRPPCPRSREQAAVGTRLRIGDFHDFRLKRAAKLAGVQRVHHVVGPSHPRRAVTMP